MLARMLLRHALAVTAAALALALSGCVTPPPLPDERIDILLDDVSITATVPGGGAARDTTGVLDCSEEATGWDYPDGRVDLVFALTSAASACPDSPSQNGQFPTWSSAAGLPADATAIDVDGAQEAYRFALTYDEYTNSHTSWQAEIALLVLDERAVMIASLELTADEFDRVLGTLDVRP